MSDMTTHTTGGTKFFSKLRFIFLATFILFLPVFSFAQEEKNEVPNGTEGLILHVPVIDSTTGKAINLDENEKNVGFSTFKVGLGFIYDYVAFSQTNEFKAQMDSANLDPEAQFKVRDFRILASGVFKTKREFSWKFAYMYDGDKDEWLVRESGLTIGVPELAGRFFIGRTKEGYSMVKVMNGHSPWTMERQMAIDAVPDSSRMVLNTLGHFRNPESSGTSDISMISF
jgi:phosphate-selective porin OprO/OprP